MYHIGLIHSGLLSKEDWLYWEYMAWVVWLFKLHYTTEMVNSQIWLLRKCWVIFYNSSSDSGPTVIQITGFIHVLILIGFYSNISFTGTCMVHTQPNQSLTIIGLWNMIFNKEKCRKTETLIIFGRNLGFQHFATVNIFSQQIPKTGLSLGLWT